ncbi:MAG: glycosyltransferase family 4 protein [Ignavibacteriaceae bacterium]
MKIVFLGRFKEGAILSGPEKFSLRLYQNVSAYSDTVFIEYFQKSYEGSNSFSRLFGKLNKKEDGTTLRLGHIRLFFYLIKSKPDVIHILTAERFTIPVYFYKRLLRGKIITTFHSVLRFEIPNDYSRRNQFNRYRDYLWEWLAIRFSNQLIFVSKQHLSLAKRFFDLKENRIAIIPNGVEKEFYAPDSIKNFNHVLNIVFYNGINDSIDRGINLVVQALNQINQSLIKLFVIGKRIKLDGVKFNIEFVAPMQKEVLVKFLVDKQILIKSSAYDSFSIFAAECMSAGLIVVISDNVGLSSYINDGRNGFVYNHLQPEIMKNIILKIINRSYDLDKISLEAKKIFFELSWRKIAEQYLNIYRS